MAKPTLDEAMAMIKAEAVTGIANAIAKYEAAKLACEEAQAAMNNPAFLGMVPTEIAPIASSFQHMMPLFASIEQARQMLGLVQSPAPQNPFTGFDVPPEAGGAG